jgi:alkylation response protein AidB-like acyl-CoA dehydrogenase
MAYRAPLGDIEATLSHMVGADRLAATGLFAEATPETRRAVLGEAGRLCEDRLAPLDRVGDVEGARLENGVVRLPSGFAEGYAAIREGGWTGVAASPEFGGMGLPQTLWQAVNEMMSGACLALSLCPLLSAGQIEALEAHADERLKALYLPKLVSGDWTGTMNLTEPQAGTDVGAVRTRAEPAEDGSWRLTGQKIYISWGDHDAAENVIHLVLARLPDAPEGAKGISLFLAPKILPREDGSLGERNRLRPISIERKLGLHASPTCVMEYDGATAWLVGAPHRGLAAMFTMMNNARLGVGVEGVGIAEAACQKAAAFARERRQGGVAIVEHADVRRMLVAMRARTLAARAICYACGVAIDLSRAAPEAERAGWAARAAFLTPIAKAFGTDVGREVADLGLQVHGGMGYVEETGAAQLWRDVRVTAIYEGANGVQAMDLVGRKLADGGAAARALLAELEAEAGDAPALAQARRALAAATAWMAEAPPRDRQAGATPFLRAWALTLGAHLLAKGAAAEPSLAPFAEFLLAQEAPHVAPLLAAARQGAAALDAVDAERLSA